jgi:hypothetical protein
VGMYWHGHVPHKSLADSPCQVAKSKDQNAGSRDEIDLKFVEILLCQLVPYIKCLIVPIFSSLTYDRHNLRIID